METPVLIGNKQYEVDSETNFVTCLRNGHLEITSEQYIELDSGL